MLKVQTSQLISRPAEQVFEAWVDPARMAGYFISRGSGRLEAGQTVVWHWDDFGAQLDVEVLVVERPQRLSFRWSASGVPAQVEATFAAESPGSTRVTVIEAGWWPDAEGIARYGQQTEGWVHMLTCLKAYLEYGINLRETRAPA